MIWLVWRRQRAAVLVAGGLLAAYAAFLLVLAVVGTGPPVVGSPYVVILAQLLLVVLPGVVGVILGAGLFGRELERGTHVFALTQGVGRVRWWATGMLALGVPAVVAVVAVTWFAGTVFGSVSEPYPLDTPYFDATGALPAVHLLLAFTLASTIGLVTRNVLGAVVVAVGVVLVVQVVLPTQARFDYLAPLSSRAPVESVGAPDDVRTLYVTTYGADGRPISLGSCPPEQDLDTCMRGLGVTEMEYVYQPQSRYVLFQAIEAGILLALTAAVAVAGRWGLRRRRVW